MKEDQPETTNHRDDDVQRDDTLARLMNLAGPRLQVPADVQRRVRARVDREWQQTTRQRRALRWFAPLALAASLLLVVVLTRQDAPPPAIPTVATVVRVNGSDDNATIHPGDRLLRDSTLTTGAAQSVSLALPDGTSLRLAPHSSLRFDAARTFTLERGEVYADTGARIYRDSAISIATPFASITDVGTQFAVRLRGDGLRVAVREGQVDVAHEQSLYAAEAGELLSLQQGQPAVYDQIAVDDPAWDWAIAVAPVFAIDNQSLLDFLKWAARETGRELIFASDELRMSAMRTVLHGSIQDISPAEATEAVLATTGFRYRVSDRYIYIDQ